MDVANTLNHLNPYVGLTFYILSLIVNFLKDNFFFFKFYFVTILFSYVVYSALNERGYSKTKFIVVQNHVYELYSDEVPMYGCTSREFKMMMN